MVDANLESNWTDVCNVFQFAIDNNFDEVNMLDHEAKAYAVVMSELMVKYSMFAVMGYFQIPEWMPKEYDNYSATFKAIGNAAENNTSINIPIDEIKMQMKVLDEFIRQLFPIIMVMNPDSVLKLMTDHPEWFKRDQNE